MCSSDLDVIRAKLRDVTSAVVVPVVSEERLGRNKIPSVSYLLLQSFAHQACRAVQQDAKHLAESIGIPLHLGHQRSGRLWGHFRLLARNIKHLYAACSYILRGLHYNCRFAYTRLAGYEHKRAFDYSAAEHAIKLTYTCLNS